MYLERLRDIFKKLLAWKENQDECIQELIDQDARNSLHTAIKKRLSGHGEVRK